MGIHAKIKDIDLDVKIKFLSFLILIIFGVLPSLLFRNWEWFSRSGSLLVIFGVYIAWRDYKGEIDGALSNIKTRLKELHKEKIKDINEKEKGIINPVVKKGKADNKLSEAVDFIHSTQDSNKSMYENLEFGIIFLGTVIWGYGDLLNTIYC